MSGIESIRAESAGNPPSPDPAVSSSDWWTQGATAPQSLARGASLFATWVGEMPMLALGAAFLSGVTLGWMIKR
jgi:hypothetical protein